MVFDLHEMLYVFICVAFVVGVVIVDFVCCFCYRCGCLFFAVDP